MDNNGRVCVKVEKDVGIPEVLDRLKERTDSKNKYVARMTIKKLDPENWLLEYTV